MPTLPPGTDYLNPRIWTGVILETPKPRNLMFKRWFPDQNVEGDHLEWDVLKGQEYQLAPFVSPGAESPKMDFGQRLTKAWADTLFMRYKTVLDENDVRILREFGSAPDQSFQGAMRNTALAEIKRRADALSQSIDARVEWLEVKSMLGQVAVLPTDPENVYKSDISFTLTYNVGTAVPVAGSALWSDVDNSDPELDISTWLQALTWTPEVMVISKTMLWNLGRNVKLKRSVFLQQGIAAGDIPSLITRERVLQFLSAQFGLEIMVYDTEYTTRTYNADGSYNVIDQRFMPSNKVLFTINGPLGYFADTPSPYNDYAHGKFAWTEDPRQTGRVDPWQHVLGAGRYGLPLFQRPDRVVVATVA